MKYSMALCALSNVVGSYATPGYYQGYNEHLPGNHLKEPSVSSLSSKLFWHPEPFEID